ncbi:hypothetical protein BDD43_3444 [Mucilaginibacter gracilis]|uniref:Zinc ribbon protein n=1 Tax=Mucilaginibacter gracilis TaxID=423350 RepID=A0A495J3J1_9SPHI|nr:hypothetical protein [Mucilaginibacter gracilis]RKR83241.1 hypothetical protein BDD43_3444 [Mucilaginibacter gracilis]
MENNVSIETTQPTFCGACSVTVNDSDAFCDSCGYPLKGTEFDQRNFIANRNSKEIDLEEYQKNIANAGKALYWVAVACAVSGLVLYAVSKDEQTKMGILVINLILTIIFVALGAWSRKKPFAAIISGATLYGITIILNVIDNPLTLVKGIIFKIIIIGAFIKGIKAAIEAEKVKKELNIE